MIRRHLTVNLQQKHPLIRIVTFHSPQDSDFHEYIETTGVYFVMCHDGASADPIDTPAIGQNQDTASIGTQEKSRKVGFRSMIFKLIRRGYNIALINGLEFIDTKVKSSPIFSSWLNLLTID